MLRGIDYYRVNRDKVSLDIGVRYDNPVCTTWEIEGFKYVIGFTIESMLSDKIHARFTVKRFRRTKDLYDVVSMLNEFPVDTKKLRDCLNSRGQLDVAQSPTKQEFADQYKQAYSTLKVLSVGSKTSIEKPSFDHCMAVLDTLLTNITTDRVFVPEDWR